MLDALSHGTNPFFTSLLFYPAGASLIWHTLNSPLTALAVPVTAMFGPIAAYNTIAIVAFVTSGYTMYLLARHLTGSSVAAFFSGALFTFAPYHIAKLYDSQLNLISVQFLPLFVLLVLIAYRSFAWKTILASSIVLILITMTDLYYALFSLIFLGLYALLCILQRPPRRTIRNIIATSICIVLPLLMIALPIFFLGQHAAQPFSDWKERQILSSATPLDLVLPNPFSPLWGAQINSLQQRYRLGSGGTATGLGVLIVAAVGAITQWRRVRIWTILAVILFVLELGPILVLNGYVTGIPLPYTLIDLLPGATMGRRPNHLIVYRLVVLCIMAAYGLMSLRQRVRPRWRWLTTATIAALLVLDLLPSQLSTAPFAVSPFYKQITTATHGAILELPPQPEQSTYLMAQLVHGRPLVGGYLSRNPENPVVKYADGLHQLWNAKAEPMSILYPEWTQAIPYVLSSLDIEYVIIHLDNPESEQYAALENVLAPILDMVYRDPSLVAYQRRGAALANIVAMPSDMGWYPLESEGDRHWQWTDGTAELMIANYGTTTRETTLDFRISAFTHDRAMTIEQREPSGWQPLKTITVTPGEQPYTMTLQAPPGITTLRFAANADPSSESTPRDLSIVFTQLQVHSSTTTASRTATQSDTRHEWDEIPAKAY